MGHKYLIDIPEDSWSYVLRMAEQLKIRPAELFRQAAECLRIEGTVYTMFPNFSGQVSCSGFTNKG